MATEEVTTPARRSPPRPLDEDAGSPKSAGSDSPPPAKRREIDPDFRKYAPITYKVKPPSLRDPIHQPKEFVKDLVNVHKRRRIASNRTKVTPIGYTYKGALTPEMCESVRECYHYVVDNRIDSPGRVKFGSKSAQYGKVGGHKCCYLKNDGKNAFRDKCPKVEQRIMELAYDFDTEYKVLSDFAEPQSVEYIQYKSGDWIGWHSDLNGSVITLVTMLSGKDRYEGGDLQLKWRDQNGKTQIYGEHLDCGDTIVFLSQDQDHRVIPVTWGRRRVLVIEVKQHRDDEDHHSSDESSTSSDSEGLQIRKERRREEKLKLLEAARARHAASQVPNPQAGGFPPSISFQAPPTTGTIERQSQPAYKGAL